MTILVEPHAHYRLITLNRPERLNALTVETAEALGAALDAAEADESCHALLITGAGRAFCAGQDLTAIVGIAPAGIGHLLDHYNQIVGKLRALPMPVVCAVNGVAAGAGANLALAAAEANDLDEQLELERDFQEEAAATPDHAEGVRAFLEKRPPVFIGQS